MEAWTDRKGKVGVVGRHETERKGESWVSWGGTVLKGAPRGGLILVSISVSKEVV